MPAPSTPSLAYKLETLAIDMLSEHESLAGVEIVHYSTDERADLNRIVCKATLGEQEQGGVRPWNITLEVQAYVIERDAGLIEDYSQAIDETFHHLATTKLAMFPDVDTSAFGYLSSLGEEEEDKDGGRDTRQRVKTYNFHALEYVEEIDEEAEAFAARLGTASYELPSERLLSYSRFIIAAKDGGYWDKLIEIYPLEGITITAACVKLKSANGAPSSCANAGFTNSSVVANGGIQGNGTSYLTTGVNYSDLTSGLGGLSAWIGAEFTPSTTSILMGVTIGSTPQASLDFSTTSGGRMSGRWGGSTLVNLDHTVFQPGLYHASRSSATALGLSVNGVATRSTATATSLATKASGISLFAGTTAFPCSARSLWFALDDGTMTAAEKEAYAENVGVLMVALGRVVPLDGEMHRTAIIGQSLAAGASGTPILTVTPVYSARTNASGVLSSNSASNPASLVDSFGALRPLYEAGNETIASGFAGAVAARHRAVVAGSTAQDVVIDGWGRGSTAYSGLKKGQRPYENSIDAIRASKLISPLYRSGGFRVPGLLVIHGESDGDSITYQADIEQWQEDYQADINAITGRSDTIPLFHSQPSSWTATTNLNSATSRAAYAILAAHKAAPTRTVLVCPKYIMTHSDGVHLTNEGYRWLGEYYAKAWYQHLIEGVQWEPLRPSSVVRSGATITISFAGAKGNLALDTTLVSNPGNYGFEWAQTGGTARTISSVALSGDYTQVIITLSGDPGTPTTERVRYAYTGTAGNYGGPTTGPRGNLRDSDPATSLHGYDLSNWCVHFDEAVV